MSDEKAARKDKVAAGMTNALLKAVDEGVGPLTGATDYANSRANQYADPEEAIRRIVRETIAASGTTGFTTGLGGFVTLPVALPVNITGQAILNARMVAAIAHLRGWDLRDEVVRSSLLIVVAGGSPNAILSQFGVKLGQKLAETAIKKIPIAIIREINKKAGFMLLAKYGTQRSMVTLAKGVPIAGGIVGGTVDAAFTKAVSAGAKQAFPPLADGASTRTVG